jgi:hypothetical protein
MGSFRELARVPRDGYAAVRISGESGIPRIDHSDRLFINRNLCDSSVPTRQEMNPDSNAWNAIPVK